MRIRTFCLAALLTMFAVTGPPVVEAVDAGVAFGHARHGHGCHVDRCPRCHCKVSIEEVKEKKTCFDVTCEPICIPRIRFPWEKCCEPKCARIKFVNVVKKVTYECKKCKYKFEPVCCEDASQACGECATTEEAAAQDPQVVPPVPHDADAPR